MEYSSNGIFFGNNINKVLMYGAKPINLEDITSLHKDIVLYHLHEMYSKANP